MAKLLFLAAALIIRITLVAQLPVNILVVIGGHDFDTVEFKKMWDELPGISWTMAIQPEANHKIATGEVDDYAVLVFYDMMDAITAAEKAGYLRLFQHKKPMIFLHHSLVSYQRWAEFRDLIGGRYHTLDQQKPSNYHHDQWMNIKVVDSSHPVTKGIPNYIIYDETYGQVEILPTVRPLLTSDHPLSMPMVGWINTYAGHEVIYLQGGHGPEAFSNQHFRQLILQAILWSIRKS